MDNCYGEFVEEREPTHAGADLIVGSLIKNPGGGLAKGGGYLVGSEEAVSRAAERYTAPGIGKEIGATYPGLWDLYMGFFLAPHHVAEALKGASFAAALLARLGFAVSPAADEPRTDIIQAITFGNRDALLDFLAAVQEMSPVDAFVTPVPDEMPGYADLVVMAGGRSYRDRQPNSLPTPPSVPVRRLPSRRAHLRPRQARGAPRGSAFAGERTW